MIKKFSELVKKTINKVKPLIKLNEKDIECAIDDQIVDCKEVDKQPYTGIPAPVVRKLFNRGNMYHQWPKKNEKIKIKMNMKNER